MTTFDANLIDRIVRDVMSRLRDADRGASNDTLVLDEAVLTEESLADRVNGYGAIVVGCKTVLTPTARDYLRKRKITYTRLGDAPVAKATGDRLAIIAVEADIIGSAIDAVGWTRDTTDCWKVATQRAVDALQAGTAGVVVFSDQDAAVGCIANRNPDVRAAIVDDAHGVRAARKMIGPNLLVVDPFGKTFVELRGILKEFADGSTAAPAGWEASP